MRFSALAMIAGLLLCGDARAQSGTGAKDPNLAPETPRLEVQRRPFARANRLAINLTYGFGSSGLGDVHELTDYWASTFGRQPIEDSKGSLQINAAIGFTYYAPYHILAHVGYGAIYEKATADVGGGIMFENWNLLMEVPILVGGYYAFKDRFWVWGAIGPSIHFYGRSWYDLDGPGILDAKTETGAGMQVKIGADVMTSEPFSVGLALIYRLHKTSVLVEKKSGAAYPPGAARQDYTLDMSGISLELNLRFWVM